jgi:hypothetical protein
VGSGLILLLIVGAWLAVLVPMALRSHEAASALGTVDRFSDAMRVLARRSSASEAHAEAEADAPTARRRAPAAPPRTRTGPTPAARRRRAVGVLVLLAVGALVGGILGPVWLLGVHALADGLLLAVFLWLRSQAVLREERAWRAAMGDRRSGRASQPWSPLEELAAAPVAPHVAVYGVPDRMPARREIASTDSVFDQYADAPSRPRTAPVRPAVVLAPAAQVPPARGAKGEPWQPVPVPVPTYVTAPRAPRRLIDLTAPSPASALASTEHSIGIDDQGPELEHILGRRAVGD